MGQKPTLIAWCSSTTETSGRKGALKTCNIAKTNSSVSFLATASGRVYVSQLSVRCFHCLNAADPCGGSALDRQEAISVSLNLPFTSRVPKRCWAEWGSGSSRGRNPRRDGSGDSAAHASQRQSARAHGYGWSNPQRDQT